MLGIVTRQRPGQDDDYTQINALANQQRDKGWKIRHIILGTGDVGRRDLIDAGDVHGEKEILYGESIENLTRAIGECTSLISMKFHGSVVATMYGVPSTVLIPTSKNRNFMRLIGRDDLLSKFDDIDLLGRFNPEPSRISQDQIHFLRNSAKKVLDDIVETIKANI